MIIALTLLGCTAWIDQEPACDQDVYYWSDDLLAYVLAGDGSGDFELDPVDEPRTEVDGGYDPDNGDFSWVSKYDEDFYLRKAEADGFGTVFHNGNLDLLYTQTVTDMLGDVLSTMFRVQRTGCDMTIATWDADGDVEDALVMAGSYDDGDVWSWSVDYPGYTWTGALRPTLLRTSTIDADDGSYFAFTSEKPTGETTQEWSGDCYDGFNCEGESTRNFDGTFDAVVSVFDGEELYAEITGIYDYDTSGTQTIAYVGGPTCEYVYEADDSCTYECDDGDDGAC